MTRYQDMQMDLFAHHLTAPKHLILLPTVGTSRPILEQVKKLLLTDFIKCY